MRRYLSIFVVVLFCVPFVFGQRGIDSVSESGDSLRLSMAVELTTDGVKAMNIEGDVRRASKLFTEALLSDSTYAPANYLLSDILLSSAPDSAVIYSKRAYLSDTTNYWYLNRYAQSVVTKGDYTTARMLYTKLLEIRPNDINAYRILALLYQQQSQIYSAISLLDTAEVRVGRNPYLVALKRQFLLSTNQVDRAIRETKEIIAEMPYDNENRVALAELYRQMGRDTSALRVFERAFAIDSTHIQTLVAYADFSHSQGKDSIYLDMLRRIMQSHQMNPRRKIALIKDVTSDLELYRRERMRVNQLITALVIAHPNNVDVVELQAQHLISMGMLDEALLVMKSHLNDEPAHLRYYRSVIDIERYQQRIDSALYYLNRAVERFPREESLRFEYSYMLVSQGHYDDAIESCLELLDGATDSLSSSVWGTVGDIYHHKLFDALKRDSLSVSGNEKRVQRGLREVYKSYDKSLEYLPNNVLVLNNYAYFLSEYGGDLDLALQMSKRSIEVESSNPTYIDTYAWILYRLGHYDEAKSVMRRAVSLDTTQNAEIALHYAEILSVLDENTMADFYWDKALQWGATEDMLRASRIRAAENKERLKSE